MCAEAKEAFDIRSEERGSHWVAWLQNSESQKPQDAVILIGANAEQAEERARRWAERKATGSK